MLDIISTGALMDAKPEYIEAIRCMIDMELSSFKDNFIVVVPGEFNSLGKPVDLTTDDWFEPSLIGVTYGDSIPEDWLLVGVYNAKNATEDEFRAAFQFIAERNLGLINK